MNTVGRALVASLWLIAACTDPPSAGTPFVPERPTPAWCSYTATQAFVPLTQDRCDPFAQDCATGACYLVSGAFQCVTTAGTARCNQSCSRNQDCAPLLGCEAGQCRPLCVVGDACAEGAWCADSALGSDVGTCAPHKGCANANDCDAGQGCYAFSDNTACAPSSANTANAAPCALATDCAPGLQCLRGTCGTSCDPESAASCDDGQCVDDGRTLGACLLPCSPWQDDCPTAQRCVALEGIAHCMTADTSPSAEGAPCERSVECAVGLECLYGRCKTLCDPHAAEPCSGGDTCIGMAGSAYGACYQSCDPLGTACPPGEQCVVAGSGNLCASEGAGLGEGEACSYVNDCSAGLSCGLDERCRANCAVNSNAGCDAESLCVGLNNTHGTCAQTCDVVDATCANGTSCIALGNGNACLAFTPGDTAEGEPCLWVDECAAGLVCLGQWSEYRCHRPCSPAGTACPEGSCQTSADLPYGVCAQSCSAIADACNGTDSCKTGALGPACLPPGNASQGESCALDLDCGAELLCLGGICLSVCDPDNDTCTSSVCHAWNHPVHGIIGLCQPTCDVTSSTCPAGWGCYFDNTDVICSPPAPDPGLGIGQSCNYAIACAPGLQCALGTCRDTCTTSATLTCATPDLCEAFVGTTGACMHPCSPLTTDCEAHEGCYFSLLNTYVCMEGGSVAVNGSCTYSNDCTAGLLCIGTAPDYFCRTTCSTDGSVTCSTGTCTEVTGFAPLGYCQP